MTPDTLATLHARCFTSMPPPWSAAGFAALLGDPHVVLRDDHLSRGFALIRVIGDEAELLTLAVDPTFRRNGIGRGLMERVDTCAQTRGAQKIFLEVAETNQAARALYDTCGFRQVGRRPGYFRAPDAGAVAALILCKSLV